MIEEQEEFAYDSFDYGETEDQFNIRQKIQAYNERQSKEQDIMKRYKERLPWMPIWMAKAFEAVAGGGTDLLLRGPNRVLWNEQVIKGKKEGKSMDQIKKENPRLWQNEFNFNNGRI